VNQKKPYSPPTFIESTPEQAEKVAANVAAKVKPPISLTRSLWENNKLRILSCLRNLRTKKNYSRYSAYRDGWLKFSLLHFTEEVLFLREYFPSFIALVHSLTPEKLNVTVLILSVVFEDCRPFPDLVRCS
jgi:hypothetical protein